MRPENLWDDKHKLVWMLLWALWCRSLYGPGGIWSKHAIN